MDSYFSILDYKKALNAQGLLVYVGGVLRYHLVFQVSSGELAIIEIGIESALSQ